MTEPVSPHEKKPLYKRIWFWVIAVPAGLAVIGILHGPAGQDKVNEKQAGEQTASAGSTAADDAPTTCDSSDAAGMVKSALEGSSSALQTVQVLDFGRAQETYYDKMGKVRGCKADAELNVGGSQLVTYQLYFGPSGKALVRVETGVQAEMIVETDPDRKKSFAERDEQLAHPSAQDQVQPNAPVPNDPQSNLASQPNPSPNVDANQPGQADPSADQVQPNAPPQQNNQ